jgi:hypothetical protein
VTAIFSARRPELMLSVDLFNNHGAEVIAVTDSESSSGPANVERILRGLIAGGRCEAFYTCKFSFEARSQSQETLEAFYDLFVSECACIGGERGRGIQAGPQVAVRAGHHGSRLGRKVPYRRARPWPAGRADPQRRRTRRGGVRPGRHPLRHDLHP